MTTSAAAPIETETKAKPDRETIGEFFLRAPAVGPALALIVAIVVFSLTTTTFLDLDNMSLVVQQSLVVGTLALGQTLIILTSGIDLSNAAAMVLGTLLMAKLVGGGVSGLFALIIGTVATVVISAFTGALVTRIKVPPFIVTLGLFTMLTAAAKLVAGGQAVPVSDGLLTWLGTKRFLFGGIPITYGMTLALLMYIAMWYALSKTAWGKHVYAVGNAPESSRLSGIKINRTIVSVYITAGVIFGIAAWQALGRVPNADPNAYQTGNLDSITAVVLGGASLFGGRGSVIGTLLGALVVAVLRSGLTQMGVDALYQDVATGALLIAAVIVDRLARRQA